ncbi:hypothetical protein BT96DRAFT_833336, partial [Gymnopus androsaceus JB14]
ILSLLDFYHSQQLQLCVPHEVEQTYCYNHAMKEMNEFIHTYGQPEVDHHCNKCVRNFFKDGQGNYLRGCLSVQVQANSGSRNGGLCSLVGCNASVTSGSKTCADKEHKNSECRYYEVSEAAFCYECSYLI